MIDRGRRNAGALLVLVAAACGDAAAPLRPVIPPPGVPHAPTPIEGPMELRVPTYEGSGQIVEPDVVYRPAGWKGWEYWMVFNPYPYGNARAENPSIVVSHDGRAWTVPAGLSNPVVPRDAPNSDPDLAYDAIRDRLVLVYRQVRGGENVIKASWSFDGIGWHAPRVEFHVPNHRAIGPAIVLAPGRRARIWYLDAGPAGCQTAASTLMTRLAPHRDAVPGVPPETDAWAAARTTDLAQANHVIWEADVEYVPALREYFAVYPAYPLTDPSCAHDDLFFARSRDGVTWRTYRVPFLRRGSPSWAAASLYRATLVFDAGHDRLRIWFSAVASNGSWHLGYVAYDFHDFVRALDGR